MTAAAFRCAVASELRGDAMAGTAPPAERVLLIHQPGPWGPRGFVESRCDPDVARRIDRAAADAGMRLQAIRRPGKHVVGVPEGGFDVGVADTRAATPSITWWRTDDLATIATELESGLPRRPPSAVDAAPLYLVCAHGRHDACCALRGRPVAAELQRVRPGRVWETTHLGGDRFAANVLILPSGELYGRVPPVLIDGFVDRIEAGEVVPALLRGRIGLTPIAQAALAFAHERLGIAARDALTVTSIEQRDDERAVARLQTPNGTIEVTIGIDVSEPAQLTCRGPQHAKARQYRGVAIREIVA